METEFYKRLCTTAEDLRTAHQIGISGIKDALDDLILVAPLPSDEDAHAKVTGMRDHLLRSIENREADKATNQVGMVAFLEGIIEKYPKATYAPPVNYSGRPEIFQR
ncbi:MAG TPA: hypothetical protein VJI46_02135 [Candidatus Nanoarchaeia archaeon]|nr:hypothetical protein [Candidatus Nanoarchaeia archaeon]